MENQQNTSLAKTVLDMVIDIPAKNWTTGSFSNGKNKCCLHGHIMRLSSDDPNDFSLDNCSDRKARNNTGSNISTKLRAVSRKFLDLNPELWWVDSSSINNGDRVEYPQKTPKPRSIKLLKDMIKAGY